MVLGGVGGSWWFWVVLGECWMVLGGVGRYCVVLGWC